MQLEHFSWTCVSRQW